MARHDCGKGFVFSCAKLLLVFSGRHVKVCKGLCVPKSRRKLHNMTEGIQVKVLLLLKVKALLLLNFKAQQRGRESKEGLNCLCWKNFRQRNNILITTHSNFTNSDVNGDVV